MSEFQVLGGIATERHGSEYGGWVLCPAALHAGSVVYSLGIGEDISFDLSLIRKYGLQVHAFDPTPRSMAWLKTQALPPQFHAFGWGLADYDGTTTFHPPRNPAHISHTMLGAGGVQAGDVDVPVRRLRTIMRELGHTRIDILKMDIEGAEYAVIRDALKCCIPIGQLLVEFHHHNIQAVDERETVQAMRALRRRGYRLFNVSKTDEFAFLNTRD